jgi:hypothetical protein
MGPIWKWLRWFRRSAILISLFTAVCNISMFLTNLLSQVGAGGIAV